MELRHLRYFVAVAEDQHYGRAAQRLRVAQPALSRQIQDLEHEIGFELFDRLPRGVRLSVAGKAFLEDVRSILRQVSAATDRAGRVARGLAGTVRVGFPESASWHGIVPDSFRRFRHEQPDAELQLSPMSSLEQVQALRAGSLDAGFVFNFPKSDPDLDQLVVATHHLCSAEAVLALGERAETTQVIRLLPTSVDYWICTTCRSSRLGAVSDRWRNGSQYSKPSHDVGNGRGHVAAGSSSNCA